ncbi:MAG TPA: hypothetical protein VL285_11985 [Bryobacteraceae bacterium]|nr:hypothetical protein [Bryobacteraceae bacterium]
MRNTFTVLVLSLGLLSFAAPQAYAVPTNGHPPLSCKMSPHGKKKCGGTSNIDRGGGDATGTGDDNSNNNSGQVNPQCYYNCTHGAGAMGDRECTYSCQQ